MNKKIKSSLILLPLLISACSLKSLGLGGKDADQETVESIQSETQTAKTMHDPLSTDITAPPKFEKETKKSDGEKANGGPASYQEWLRQQQEEK